MASRTQLRLGQLTGSFKDVEGGIVDTLGANSGGGALGTIALASGSMVSIISELASAIKRINGGATFANQAAGIINQNVSIVGTTPKLTIGDNGNEDVALVFNSAGTDFQIGVDHDENTVLRISTSDFDGSAEVAELSATLNGFVGDVSTGGTFLAGGDVSAGDDAAVGYTAAKGIIITGQGSTNDVTIMNDAKADVISVPTGTTNVEFAGNITVGGNLDVNGTTTTIDSVNLTVQDSIIALGVSGSGAYSNVGDRGILFPRGDNPGAITAGLWWDNTQFNLAKTLTGPTSSSFSAPSSANWAQLKAGNLLPGVDNTYDLGSTSLAWKDLNLQGDVLMTDAGKVETTAGDLTISSAAAQVVVDANTNIILDANNNGSVIFRDTNDAGGYLNVRGFDTSGGGALSAVLSASMGDFILATNQDSFTFTHGEINYGSPGAEPSFDIKFGTAANDIGAARKIGFFMGTLSDSRIRLELDDRNQASCVHDLSGSLLLDDGATSGEIRFQEAGTGNNYMGIRAPDDVTANKTLILPDGHPAANNAVLVASTAGVLSYSTGIGATTKAIYILTASHDANVNFKVTSDNGQHVGTSDSISALTLSDAQGKNLDVFVNGQLLHSGSSISAGAGQADYKIQAAADIRFAFALETDDIVQIIKRG